MNNIIVTVCDQKKSFEIDLELPVMQMMDSLNKDIVEVLEECQIKLPKSQVQFFVPRLKRVLNVHETLASAGVYNGDYLTII